MSEIFSKSYEEAITEIQVLNEALNEAEELTNELNSQIDRLLKRNELLENCLLDYGISFEYIDNLLDVI
ncbi:MAG: hypothetical protein Q4A15_12890 [Prevotellaceae bacterium]|nr:hypothetical protein [Prevotellaceae bacterium]